MSPSSSPFGLLVAPWLQAHVPPQELARIQQEFAEQWMAYFQSGERPALDDRRFKSPAWQEHPWAWSAASQYLLSSKTLREMVAALQVEPALKQRIEFALEQWLDACSPANFLALNPDAQQLMVETHGESLRRGLSNFITDLQKGRITQSDESQFEVGRNVAVTPGSVIYQNRLMQLIQYQPVTPTVHERPLLIVPPCINKYYILDLQPQNSLAAYMVSQGHTVFMVSWRNPLPADTDGILQASWDDYLRDGVLTALALAASVTGQKQVNAMGFCVGGTLLATALAAAKAQGLNPVASLTLLTTFLDFADTGIMDVFIDEAQVALREAQLGRGGLMTAAELATTFSFLRPNELVWNYVVGNYLKGESPKPFDLLYWNADSTHLPGPFFAWYLRHTYLQNDLVKPGRVSCLGVPIDLGQLDMPAYLYASKDDHIVPWKSAYASTRVLQGPKRFVLGASGHIAGVINPPAAGKRSHWVPADAQGSVFPDAEQWFEAAQQRAGSWWPDWAAWLQQHAGAQVPALQKAGGAGLSVIEPAPGSYVRVRAV